MRGISCPPRSLGGSTATCYILGSLVVSTSEQRVNAEFLPYENIESAALHGQTNGQWQPVPGDVKKSVYVPPTHGKSLSYRNPSAAGLRVSKQWRFTEFIPFFDVDGDLHGQVLKKLLESSEWQGASITNTSPSMVTP